MKKISSFLPNHNYFSWNSLQGCNEPSYELASSTSQALHTCFEMQALSVKPMGKTRFGAFSNLFVWSLFWITTESGILLNYSTGDENCIEQ